MKFWDMFSEQSMEYELRNGSEFTSSNLFHACLIASLHLIEIRATSKESIDSYACKMFLTFATRPIQLM